MSKVHLGPQALLYPLPVVLVGANVGGKPNFMTASWCGIASSEPPMLTVALRHQRYTYKGVRENLTFSVNIPSSDLFREADYCGLESGAREEKQKVCGFRVFYGRLGSAPLIEQCPVNLECQVAHILDLGSHALIVGRIEETYASEDCLTGGQPDVNKVKPFLYSKGARQEYQTFGSVLGTVFRVGRELKQGKN
ncbi:MAG: flavin reductase family protein [Chloroflexota bacterium]